MTNSIKRRVLNAFTWKRVWYRSMSAAAVLAVGVTVGAGVPSVSAEAAVYNPLSPVDLGSKKGQGKNGQGNGKDERKKFSHKDVNAAFSAAGISSFGTGNSLVNKYGKSNNDEFELNLVKGALLGEGFAGDINSVNWLGKAEVNSDDPVGTYRDLEKAFPLASGADVEYSISRNNPAGPFEFTLDSPAVGWQLVALLVKQNTNYTIFTGDAIAGNRVENVWSYQNPEETSAFSQIAGSMTPVVDYYRTSFNLGDQASGGISHLTAFGTVAPVPLPPSVAMLGLGLAGLLMIGYRRRNGERAAA